MSDMEMMTIKGAPTPKGAYSTVVRAGDFLYVSGQAAIDPATGEFVFGTIEEETRLTLENIAHILEGCGATLANVVKCAVFLAHYTDFSRMNAEYAKFFPKSAPARTTVAVTMVAPPMKIEIDCVAYLPAAK